MTLQQIRYFLEVSQTEKFTVAANNLFIAQSSLSYAIHELEHELGVPLFARNVNKRVRLTEYGEKFRPYAEKIFQVLSDGENALKSMKNPLSGTVKLGFFYCVANSEIPSIFRKFYDDNPDCDIFLDFDVNQGNGMIEDQMQLGKYDLIISTAPTVRDCDSVKIGSQTIKLIVPNDHPLAGKKTVTLAETEGETLIGINAGGNLDMQIREMYAEQGLKPDITYCTDWLTQFGYVAMRYGIAISSSMPVYKEYIAEINIDHPRIKRSLYLHWPNNRKLSKATAFVRDYIIALTNKDELC